MVRDEWKEVPLGEVVTLQRGYDLPHKKRQPGAVPIVSSSGISGKHIEPRVASPGVITGRYGTIGEVFFIQEDFWPLNTTLYVKDFKGNDPLFISYLLRTIDYHSHSDKSGVPGVNRNDLHEIIVNRPSPPEQRAIAGALSDVDALIRGLDQLIAKKGDLKQAAMEQLLTGKQRLPGFSGKWEVKKLGAILSYEQPTNYLVESSEYNDNNDIAVLTANKSFILGYTDEIDGVFENVPVIIFDDFTTASKYVDFPFKVKSSALKILKLKDDNYDLRFVFGKMQFIRFPMGDHKRYWISEYQHIEIEIPSIKKEQAAIVTVLADMDAEIAALEQRIDKTRDLKQGMMQELLTGRIRLL